jgi:hypothetical protein
MSVYCKYSTPERGCQVGEGMVRRKFCADCGTITDHRRVADKTFDWQSYKTVAPIWGCLYCGGEHGDTQRVAQEQEPVSKLRRAEGRLINFVRQVLAGTVVGSLHGERTERPKR